MIIRIFPLAGSFAENKDIAQKLRLQGLLPALSQDKIIILDFTGVTGVTQSFIHALISDGIRQYNSRFFDLVTFRHCSPVVQKIITIVTDYMQASDL